jgi:cysteinyl-tRNA synthetase
MASRMDVHSGGIGLAILATTMKLAQSEAYFCDHGKGEHSWVSLHAVSKSIVKEST